MKQLLLVLGFVAVFSLAASAKNTTNAYNFYFLSPNGDPYCDGMLLYNYGNPQTLVDGTHFNVYCFQQDQSEDVYTNVNGFKAPVASAYQYGGSGDVLIVSDPTLALGECEQYPGHSTDTGFNCHPSSYWYPATVYLINTTSNTWTLWVSGGGDGEYVANYGKISPSSVPYSKSEKSSQFPKSSFAR